ncbi:MAG: NAD(+)/NADH kinase [Parcubacteria group bacterium]|nr:NAD(+)/NADH kinase [Parcubacteria group bacterium]
MKKPEGRTFFLGGSFNPPGRHHESIADIILDHMTSADRLLIIPCGGRPDKESTQDVSPLHRANLCRIAFEARDSRITLDLSDLERDEYERSACVLDRLTSQGHDVWLVVGGDLIVGGADQESEIQKNWHQGQRLWAHAKFLVIPRAGVHFDKADLPPNSELLDNWLSRGASSRAIRENAALYEEFEHLVSPGVAAYMCMYGLYTSRVALGPVRATLKGRAQVMVACSTDPERSDRETALGLMMDRVNGLSDRLLTHKIVIGGDGYFLDCVQENPGDPRPSIGLNAGTVGFLLNGGTITELEARLKRGVVHLYQQPLLEVSAIDSNGRQIKELAFNEAFIRAVSNGTSVQSGAMRVYLNGNLVFDRLSGDGLMLATAAGSTGWARSHGGMPLTAGTPEMILVGAGTTYRGQRWNFARLSAEDEVTVDIETTRKRPMQLLLNGRVRMEDVIRVSMRLSRTHAATLGFFPETNLAAKIRGLYFPT